MSDLRTNASRQVVGLFAIGRGCSYDLKSSTELMSLAKSALSLSGASLAAEFEHVFVPHGLTIVLVAAESHLVLSTWPEFGTVTLDVALCGSDVDPMEGWSFLVGRLLPASTEVSINHRKLA